MKNIFSDHNEMKLEIGNKKENQKINKSNKNLKQTTSQTTNRSTNQRKSQEKMRMFLMIKSKIATYQKGLDVVNAVIWEKVIARKYSHLNRNISSENPNTITQESRKKLSPKVAEERIKIRADINEIVKKKKMQGETSTPL